MDIEENNHNNNKDHLKVEISKNKKKRYNNNDF